MKLRHSLVVVFCMLFVATVYAKDKSSKRPQYRPPTAEEMAKQYQLKAMESIIEGLRYATVAGQIMESENCPCYDVTVSTAVGSTFIRVDRSKCKEIK